MSQLQVRDTAGNGIAHINIRISEGAKSSDDAIFDVETDLAGNQGWPIPYWANATYTLWVNYANVNPAYGQTSVSVPPSAGDISIVLARAIHVLQPLQAEGWDIKHADGTRYVHNQATNYLLAQRHSLGQDISGLLYDGFDGYNVTFCMATVPQQAGLAPFVPNGTDFYDKVDAFFAFMATQGKRVEATLLCDCQLLGYADHSWQVAHTETMYDILRKYPWNLVQLANEPTVNGVDVAAFNKPAGLFWSRGSSLAGGQCPLPPGDYSTAHLTRDGAAYLDAQPAYMVMGYTGYPGTQGPVITNETRGASDTENSSRRSNDPNYFRRIASAMRGWAGGTLHADFAIHSEPCVAGSVQDQCRLAFLDGIT